MMKLLVEGDSYGLPRFDNQSGEVALSYEETYPEQLRKKLLKAGGGDIMLVNRCRHANTTYSLVSGEANELFFLRPDITIVQLGMTDLWPSEGRKIPPIQMELTGKDPGVNLTEYQENLRQFVFCANKLRSRVIIVGIPRIGPEILFRFPSVSKRIEMYNQTAVVLANSIRGVCFFDWMTRMSKSSVREMIGEDGIHPTKNATGEKCNRAFSGGIEKFNYENQNKGNRYNFLVRKAVKELWTKDVVLVIRKKYMINRKRKNCWIKLLILKKICLLK